jgi:hypothetical protein
MSTPRTTATLGDIRRISGEINRMRSDADCLYAGQWRYQIVAGTRARLLLAITACSRHDNSCRHAVP